MTNVEQQSQYLQEALGDDGSLRRRIERMLATEESSKLNPLDCAVATLEPDADRSPINVDEHPQIGPYKIIHRLGEGGMGEVYVAEQRKPLQRTVALKLIKCGMDSREVIARFEAERQALSLMNHPNIARVLEAGETDDGRPYFVMDLVRGIPITEYCDRHKLSMRKRLELFVIVCQAVQHAHQKGVIHRDLKPSNILVELHDVHHVPKVIDFGVAKASNQRLTERTLFTHFSQMIGTPRYMSPEQAELSGLDVDTRSDVYSLGVLLYELLTALAVGYRTRRLGEFNCRVKLFDMDTAEEVATSSYAVGQGHDVAWSPNGSLLAAASLSSIRVWDAALNDERVVADRSNTPATSVTWSPDGTRLAAGFGSGAITIFDATVQKQLPHIEGDAVD